ncbi:MAG: hypothetical protein JWO58_1731 [Chitinophagaceae bacterium]|nr:hypothetical protein [Chitinophagaceae bacterium]
MQLKSFLINAYFALFFLLLIFGCKRPKDSAIFISDKESLGTYYTDTFSVSLSTLLVDSLPTSVSNQLLTGYAPDPNHRTGDLTAAAYLQFSLTGIDRDGDGREDILVYDNTPVYDSTVLFLSHSYTYGDTVTTPQQKLNIHQLTEDLTISNGSAYLYNGQSFAYNPTPLLQKTVRFSTNTSQTLQIRMDNIGMDFFNKAYAQDTRVATNTAFKTYFKGLVLRPDADNKIIYGYSLNPVIILYYHDSGNPNVSLSYAFKHVNSTDLFFNQLKNNRTGTSLEPLKFQYQEVFATPANNNEAYVMTGVELMAKLQFPYTNLVHAAYPNMAINRATLIIRPKEKSFDQFSRLPNDLVLYTTNNTNIPGTIISYPGTSVAEVISPVIDLETNANTYYKFDVTDFMTTLMKNNNYNGTGLILTSPRSLSGNRTERLVLDNNYDSYTIQLKLYLSLF